MLAAMTLREVRLMADLSLHYGSKDGGPRLAGLAAKEWLSRFDVPDEDLIHYKAKLLGEPKLTDATVLPRVL